MPNPEEGDYFLYPINPGEKSSLSGTMGELRSTHFHTGIDIRTGGKTGVPVKAAADGQIVRISVNPVGYGNALYIQHANGTFTVYAHLDKFEDPIAEYVRKEQYKRKKWDVELYPEAGQFMVKKGKVIALSGNSGSSGGPHLHFDLRDANHNLLNPLKYGFEEVRDNTPPVARTLAIKPLNAGSRVDGEFARKEYDVSRKGNDYIVNDPIDVYGNIGLEVWAYDLLDNSRFHTGITEMEVLINGVSVHKQEINTFSFSEQRNILVHMPYEELQTSGKRFHKLYIEDGNNLSIYNYSRKEAFSFREDSCVYPVKIIMKDTYNNESTLSLTLNCQKPEFDVREKAANYGHLKYPQTTLIENILKVRVPKRDNKELYNIKIYAAGIPTEIAPAYELKNEAVYLYDFRNGIPDSADLCGTMEFFNYKAAIPSNKEFHYYDDKMNIHFPHNGLFDTLYLKTDYVEANDKEYFSFGNIYQPVRKYLTVTLKPRKKYDLSKYAVYAVDPAQNISYEGGKWDGQHITFSTRSFGTYTILKDDEAPKITPVKLSSDDLKFKISDELSGIKDYELTVDGKWVLMHYDYKRDLIWSEKLYESDKFQGEIILKVSDKQGNQNIYKHKI